MLILVFALMLLVVMYRRVFNPTKTMNIHLFGEKKKYKNNMPSSAPRYKSLETQEKLSKFSHENNLALTPW